METKALVTKFSTELSKAGFTIKKYSPEILVVGGVLGIVVSAIMACKATTKVEEILANSKDDVETIHEYAKNEQDLEKYSEDDKKKDLVIVYTHLGMDLAKLYGPSIILGGLSIAGILTGNNILRKRNIAIAAAYATVSTSFKEYRERVAERYGEDTEKDIRYNIKAKKFEELVLDDNGKEKKTKVTVNIADPNLGNSDYACYFDNSTSKAWERNNQANSYFLTCQQFYANQSLIAHGHIFLNEVFDSIGMDRTPMGAVVGWLYNPDDPRGDNQVDFGMRLVKRETILPNGVSGYEEVFVLDFNVDGDIHKLI